MIIVVIIAGMQHVNHMYDYCQQGWPTSIEWRLLLLGIVVYPNPTSSILTYWHKVWYYGWRFMILMESLMIEKNSKRVDFSSWPTWVYIT